MGLMSVWILGFFLNVFLLCSVFQIYFQSPIVQISKTHQGNVSSGVRRVVFFVSDGLRADSFFSNPDLHPRLTKIIRSPSSASGISDSRVPTESRCGHIALFAGLYEDPSAVFKGFKEIPGKIDNVFNRSSYSIAIGPPDVVPMLAKGVAKEKIHVEVYPKDLSLSEKKNYSFLDSWVLDRFKNLVSLKKLPTHDKTLIFLLFEVTDNAAHSWIGSPEFLASIEQVDDIVRQVEQLVNDYYGDNQTVFVFTSDHGVTHRGFHGGSSAMETETPFVVWGKGIRGFGNRGIRIKQVDFAALISGALNIPFPTNSVGRFPAFIWENQSFAYNALLANCRQIHEMLELKKSLVNKRFLPLFKFANEDEVNRLIETSYDLAQMQEFDDAIRALNKAVTLALTGVNYYETYDQTLMLVLTVYSFIAWMVLIACAVVKGREFKIQLFQGVYHLVDIVISLIFIRGVLGWSAWRLLYSLIPVYLSRLLRSSFQTKCAAYSSYSMKLKTLLGLSVFSVIGVEILVQSFYQREILTLGLLLMGLWSLKGKSLNIWKRVVWLGSIATLGVFLNVPIPLIEKLKKENPNFEYESAPIGSLAPFICGCLSIWSLRQYHKMSALGGPFKKEKLVVFLQTALALSVSVLIQFPDSLITGLVSWASLILLFTVPVLVSSSNFVALRIQSVFLAVSTPFCLVSLTYEGLFLPALYAALFILIKLEATDTRESWTHFWSLRIRDSTCTQNVHGLSDAFRRAWFHVFFVYLSFFGIGNIGSIRSFDPYFIRCFMTSDQDDYKPYVMMILLVGKIIGPILLVACFFRLLMFSKLDMERNFLIVLFLGQGMALQMFFNVTNMGTWLEMGTSITNCVVVQVIALVLPIFYFVANFLTTGSFAFVSGSFPVQN